MSVPTTWCGVSVRGCEAVALACALVGCGGDAGGSDGATASAGSSSSSGADSEDSSGSGSGSAASSAAGTGESDSEGEVTTSGQACVIGFDLAVLEGHVGDLKALIEGLPALGSTTAAAIVAAPGFPGQSSAALSLEEPCQENEPSVEEPVCGGSWCWQVGCSGAGMGWSVNAWAEPTPQNVGEVTFQALTTSLDWSAPGAPLSLSLSSTATAGPTMWSMSGAGSVNGASWSVNELFPALVAGREVVLSVSGEGGAASAALTIDSVTVATLRGDALAPTGACP